MAAMPSHPSLWHFTSGFTKLKTTTGAEHCVIEKAILGALHSLVPNNVHDALEAILDFIYYTQLPTQNSTTLLLLSDALATWHVHKGAFVRLQICDKLLFNINKLHSMSHYKSLIKDLGAADGFNTELPEQLHIKYAKSAYKLPNCKQFVKQMCTYLSRSEAVFAFDSYLSWAFSPDGLHFSWVCSKCHTTAPVLFEQSYLPLIQSVPRWAKVMFPPFEYIMTQSYPRSPKVTSVAL